MSNSNLNPDYQSRLFDASDEVIECISELSSKSFKSIVEQISKKYDVDLLDLLTLLKQQKFYKYL